MRLDLQLPEPSRCWVRYTPRAWPTSGGLWTHVGKASLGASSVGQATSGPIQHGRSSRLPPFPVIEADVSQPLDDLLYLPPVRKEAREVRDRWAVSHLAAGSPVMVQLMPGEHPIEGAVSLYDPLQSLLLGRLGDLEALPRGCTVVWPLIPGLTDDPRQWQEGCERMATAGVGRVQAQTLQLSAGQRRRLAADAPEKAFHALFHRSAPAEREFDQVAHGCGLEVFAIRPVRDVSPRVAANRRLAATMALAGELWLRLERPMNQGDDLFRAARWIDTATQDVEALAREGNLGIVEAVRGLGRELLHQSTNQQRGQQREPLLEELLTEYLRGETK